MDMHALIFPPVSVTKGAPSPAHTSHEQTLDFHGSLSTRTDRLPGGVCYPERLASVIRKNRSRHFKTTRLNFMAKQRQSVGRHLLTITTKLVPVTS